MLKYFLKHLVIQILLTISMLFVVTNAYASIGVQPLSISVAPRPGESIPISINIQSKEKVPESVAISLFRPVQQTNGELFFLEGNPKDFPEADWLKLDRTNVILAPNEEFVLKGTVKVPFNARGTHHIAVMLDPKLAKDSGALILNVRYAVIINIRIDSPGLRPAVKINEFAIVKGQNGEPQINASAQNISVVDFVTNAEVTIRDNKSKHLIERVELRPELGWQNQRSDFRVFSGSAIIYKGFPKQVLTPGDYEIRLFYRYAGNSQILLSKSVTVKDGDFKYAPGKLKNLIVSPGDLRFEGHQGTSVMKSIKLENRSDHPLKVSIDAIDVEEGYPLSIIKNTMLELKPANEFIIEPRRTSLIIVTVKFPKDAPSQGNYGKLKINVSSVADKPVLLEETMVELEGVVSGKYLKKAEATGISGDSDDKKYLLSVIVKNTGNIKITPQADIVLKDQNNNQIAFTKLTVAENDSRTLIPTKVINLIGNIDALKPGLYKAEIRLYDDSIEIGTSKLDFEVK